MFDAPRVGPNDALSLQALRPIGLVLPDPGHYYWSVSVPASSLGIARGNRVSVDKRND